MKAYFSCGAGDFIAIESFLTDREKDTITEFWLFTRAAKTIKELIRLHPRWCNLPVHIPFSEQQIFSLDTYAFFSLQHMRKLTRKLWPELNGCYDFSGDVIYPQILKKRRRYNKHEFQIEPIECDIVIDPASNADDRLVARGRNLTNDELIEFKDKNRGRDIKLIGPGKSMLPEALAMIKGCKTFFGVDSMCAAWACRQDINEITVKTVNPIYIKWLPIYDPNKKITRLIDATK